MKNLIHCKVLFGNNKENHLSQILAGYELLKQQKQISLEVEYNPVYIRQKYVHSAIIEVVVNKKHIICYDLADGYQSFHDMAFFDSILDGVDFYFKRSTNDFENNMLTNKSKVKPLGLNYHVSCKNNFYDKFSNVGITKFDYLKNYLNYLRSYKRFESNYFYDKFENKPHLNNVDYKLLYNVRIWNPDIIVLSNVQKAYPKLDTKTAKGFIEIWRADLQKVTNQRLEIIKVLKDSFGDKFVGGIASDSYSEKVAKDYILPDAFSNKFNFMKMIKENYICVASVGLHGSTGWKFGEYVAASKAILTDPLVYNLPGDFKEKNNYLVYNSSDDLVKTANNMLNNPEQIQQLEKNNFDYYNNFVRPDKMVANTLKYLEIEL